MYERILLPTDGSEHTDDVIEHALDLASKYGATIHAVYVVDEADIPSAEPDFRSELMDHFRETGERALTQVEEMADGTGVDVVTETLEGVPYEEIVDYAEENDVDLVVMGTHGRTGISHVVLGSVAERVARHSPAPVLLVRFERDED